MNKYPRTSKLLKELFKHLKKYNKSPKSLKVGKIYYDLIPQKEQQSYLAEVSADRATACWDPNVSDAKVGIQIQKNSSACNKKVWHVAIHIDTPNTDSVFLRHKELLAMKIFHGDRCNAFEYYLKAFPVLESRTTYLINE